jgi:hypothetical protein
MITCILAAALAMGVGWALPAFAACPTDLEIYWPLDENTDPYVDEIVGLEAFCGAGNCPTRVQDGGRVLHGQQFSSGTDNLQVRSNAGQTQAFDWEYNDSFTIEAWFNRSGNLSNGETEVLIGRVDGSTSLLWYVALRRISNQDRVVIGLRANNGDGSVISGALNSSYLEGDNDVSDGEWHHVALVKDEDSGSLLLYVDGVLNDSATVSYADDTDFKSANANLNIGWLNLGPSFFHFEGILDEVAIFNTAQDEDTVAYHDTLGDSGLSVCEDQAPQFGPDLPTDSALGYEFKFTAQAVGTPPITYTLKDGAAPEGMNIDAATGEVSWIPSDQDTGPVNFTVVATHEDLGSTEKEYQFEVLDLCATGISAYWQLDETTEPYGDNYDDAGTNPNDGACVGTCPQNVASDIVGNAKAFNGTDQAISVATSASAPFNWAPTDSFSIELWMRRDGDLTEGTGGTEVLIGRDSDTTSLFWFIGLRRFTGETVDRLIVNLRDKNGDDVTPDPGRQPLESTTDVVDGQWHHIVVVRDDAVDENRLYIDGVLEDTGSVDYDDTLGGFDDDTVALNIGWLDFSATQTFHYAGRLDELAMYDAALPLVVIEQHFEASPPLSYCNGTPSITSTAVTTITAGQDYSYTPTAEDAAGEDDTPLIWSLVSGPDGLAVDSATGEVTWSPGAGDVGDNEVTIQVRDQRGGTAEQVFTIAVDAGTTTTNSAPVITSSAHTEVAPGDTYRYQPTATDADGDTLTWSLTGEPTGMTIDSATGAIAWTPDASVTTTFTLTVDDGTDTDTESITITVSDTANAAPDITSTAPTSATVGEEYRYEAAADDAEGDTLTWSLTGEPAGLALDTTSGVITWTPAAGDEGDHTFTLTVSDAASGSDQEIITITVSAASNPGGGGGGGGCFIDTTTRGPVTGGWVMGILMAMTALAGIVRRRA